MILANKLWQIGITRDWKSITNLVVYQLIWSNICAWNETYWLTVMSVTFMRPNFHANHCNQCLKNKLFVKFGPNSKCPNMLSCRGLACLYEAFNWIQQGLFLRLIVHQTFTIFNQSHLKRILVKCKKIRFQKFNLLRKFTWKTTQIASSIQTELPFA